MPHRVDLCREDPAGPRPGKILSAFRRQYICRGMRGNPKSVHTEGKEKGAIRNYRISLSSESLSIMVFTKACISSYRGIGRDPVPVERSVLERPDQISFSSLAL